MTNAGRQLRVALLTNFIPPYRLPVFRELAHRVSLRIFLSTTMEGDRLWQPDFGGLDVRIQRTYTRRSGGPQEVPRETKDTHFPLDTIAELARFRPDVVISGELGFRTLSAALYCAMHPAAKLVIWATLSEESERHRGAFRLMIRRVLLHRADAVIVNGRSGRRYIERFSVPPRIVFEVPQTADVNVFARVPLVRSPDASRRLLYAGRLVSVKRVAPFLEVLARWARENSSTAIEFWMAGTGPRRDAIAAVPCPPNLRVKFLGHIAYADLPRVYADAGVLVFPSDADEWGVVVNEAMASAMPVIGSSGAQAVSELVRDGVSGWVFPAGDAAQLFEKIGAFFSASDEELNRMRADARNQALSVTPELVVDRIEDALRFARIA
jgi:glycosyltransferase involved in cell wall biosynthesis